MLPDDFIKSIRDNDRSKAGCVDVFSWTKANTFKFAKGRACHACLSEHWGDPYFGEYLNYKHKQGEARVQAFLEWLTNPEESVFADLIQALGKDFHVVRSEDGKIIAWVVSRFDVNRFVLFNFFKSIRLISEHPNMFDFWCKWALDEKKDPRIAYILSGFYNTKGQSTGAGHAPIEKISQPCDFRKFLSARHGLFNLDKNTGKGSYSGEQKNTWGGPQKFLFDVSKDIPKVTKKEVPTRFWTKYYGVGRLNLAHSDDCFRNFFDNAEKIYKEKIGV